MARLVIDPVTRIEGHLRVEVTVDGGVVTEGTVKLEQSEGDFRRFASAIHQVVCDV